MYVTRTLLTVLLIVTGLTLGACDSIDNLTNMLDSKKKLGGERKPVFPEGVPGVSMGVPPEMTKGYQEKQQGAQQQQPAQATAQQPTEQSEAAQSKEAETPKPKKVAKPKPTPAPSTTPQQADGPQAPSPQTAAWPAAQAR